MKNLLFFSLLLMVFLVSSCGKNETPGPEIPEEPEEVKANFKVIYTLSGDVSSFIKSLSLNDGFVDAESGQDAPMLLMNDDFTKNQYIFISKTPLKEIELGASFLWNNSASSDPKSITALLEIYSGEDLEQLIDSQELKVASDDVSDVFQFKYEAK